MKSVNQLHDELQELVLNEKNPGKLLQVIDILRQARKDLMQIEKIQSYIEAGGNCGELFKRLDECMIYSPKVLQGVLNRKEYSVYNNVTDKVKLRLKGSHIDIATRNRYFKLGTVLNALYEQGKLPFRDEDGTPIPVTSYHCLIDNADVRIRELIVENV